MSREHKPQKMPPYSVAGGQIVRGDRFVGAVAAVERLNGLEEQLEAERKAWRKALDSALQYVPLKDHDWIEAIVSNPAREPKP